MQLLWPLLEFVPEDYFLVALPGECKREGVHLKDPWLGEKAFQRKSKSTQWGEFGTGPSIEENQSEEKS